MDEGDANTKVLHACLMNRRRPKQIASLSKEGSILTEVDEVKQEVRSFFEISYEEVGFVRPKLDSVAFKRIENGDNDYLLQPFSEEEIKEEVCIPKI